MLVPSLQSQLASAIDEMVERGYNDIQKEGKLVDVRKIEYFLEVAETLNYSRAAERLHISHQALSKQIQQLEQELGAKLLERSTTRVTLTPAGEKVREVFTPLLQALRYGYTEVQEYIQQKDGRLRVGYFNGLSFTRMVAPAISCLEEASPHLRVELLATDVHKVQKMLEQDNLDLAIFPVFSGHHWKNFTCIPLYVSPLYIIVSERHPWYHKEEITKEDIAQEQLLIYRDRSPIKAQELMPQVRAAKRLPVDNFDTYMGILRRGEAFGLVGDTYSRREGEYRMFELPKGCRGQSCIVAAYHHQHPLRRLMGSLKKLSTVPMK